MYIAYMYENNLRLLVVLNSVWFQKQQIHIEGKNENFKLEIES